jgi:hypothetical protein
VGVGVGKRELAYWQQQQWQASTQHHHHGVYAVVVFVVLGLVKEHPTASSIWIKWVQRLSWAPTFWQEQQWQVRNHVLLDTQEGEGRVVLRGGVLGWRGWTSGSNSTGN